MATELRRRAVLDSERWAIEVMGRNGLHASAICKKLKQMGRGDFTVAQIYRVLRGSEISTLDYRNGCNEEASRVFKSAKLSSKTLPKPPKRRRPNQKRKKCYRPVDR